MNKRLLAMMSALVMSFSAMPIYNTYAETDNTAADDVQYAMPEWIPQNFTEAMHFDNEYGRTHIEDGLICCVRKKDNRYADDAPEYLTEYSGDDSMDLLTLFNETYNFVMPEKPDESDTEAYQEYLDFLHENYIDESYIEYFGDIQPDFEYEVTVYAMNPSSSVDINWIMKNPQTHKIVDSETLSFESSENGEITETDIYGWLPDCTLESYNFAGKYGEVSVHDGYIVFCGDVCWDGGLSLLFEQSGTAKLESVKEDAVFMQYVLPPVGDSPMEIRAYKPLNSGKVKVTFKEAQNWEGGYVGDTIVKYYNVDDDGNITEIDEINEGDCNNDGNFGISDIVMFQKWLSGAGEITNWQNADFTWDNNLDVFDLVLMKQALLENLPEIDIETDSISADDITILKRELLAKYPDTDMSDFTFVYNPDNYLAGEIFSVYYRGVLVHGYGDFDSDSSVYAGVTKRNDGLREVTINLVKAPEEIMAVDFSAERLSRYDMQKLLDSEEYPEFIIYVDYENKPVIAYRLEDTNGYGETIYDAITGEKITYISYIVP